MNDQNMQIIENATRDDVRPGDHTSPGRTPGNVAVSPAPSAARASPPTDAPPGTGTRLTA